MKRCPLCLLPHSAPTFADLVAEEELHVTQVLPAVVAEAELLRISRARFVQALRGFGYCQHCISIKGAIIGAEVGVAALSSPPSPAQIERDFLERDDSNVLRFPLRISNAENFRRATDGFPGPNDEAMPKEGA